MIASPHQIQLFHGKLGDSNAPQIRLKIVYEFQEVMDLKHYNFSITLNSNFIFFKRYKPISNRDHAIHIQVKK